VVYDTASGPAFVRSLTIEQGGVLRVVGPQPFLLRARREIVVHGTLDLSGAPAHDVATLNTGHIPELGGPGGAAAGHGGTGSWVTNNSTPHGGHGFGTFLAPDRGGRGGETGYTSSPDREHRRPGGGGGGILAADQPVTGDPLDPANDGLVAEWGHHGHPVSISAVTNIQPARGGPPGLPVFVDGDPTNDYWGRKPVAGGGFVRGELRGPLAGRGGGAGGDAVPAGQFPHPNWSISTDEKGGGGGGGGGLGLIGTRTFVLGATGRVRVDGGHGGRGENVLFFDAIGGNGGGGSGGFLVINAFTIDLRAASDDAITALGGRGAVTSFLPTPGDGGNGGPGVLQLHTPHANRVFLPAGKTLADLTSPDAHSLLLIH